MRKALFLKLAMVTVLGVTLLDGCVVRERVAYRRHARAVIVAPAPAPAEVVVTGTPPPPMAETVVVAPGPGYIWIRGEYIWRNNWVWVPGHWAYPPRVGARWRVGRCEIRNGVRIYVRGGWVY